MSSRTTPPTGGAGVEPPLHPLIRSQTHPFACQKADPLVFGRLPHQRRFAWAWSINDFGLCVGFWEVGRLPTEAEEALLREVASTCLRDLSLVYTLQPLMARILGGASDLLGPLTWGTSSAPQAARSEFQGASNLAWRRLGRAWAAEAMDYPDALWNLAGQLPMTLDLHAFTVRLTWREEGLDLTPQSSLEACLWAQAFRPGHGEEARASYAGLGTPLRHDSVDRWHARLASALKPFGGKGVLSLRRSDHVYVSEGLFSWDLRFPSLELPPPPAS
jgi:hypothetical protein